MGTLLECYNFFSNMLIDYLDDVDRMHYIALVISS